MLIQRCLLLLVTLYATLGALQISIQTGKEAQQSFSVMHIRDTTLFECHAVKNSVNVLTEITCIFDRVPSQNIGVLNNNFFHMTTTLKNSQFIIHITPYEKMDLFPILFDLHKENALFHAQSSKSKHWSIIGYKEKNPFSARESFNDTAINFPVLFTPGALPFVGGLDLNGNPLEMQPIKDVAEYMKIKEYYKTKQYDAALQSIRQMQERYPHSIFSSELALYNIRTLHQLHESEAMLEASKQFIREFSSDQNIAEVLVYTAHAYSKLGMFSDADYFYDHLFNEHGNSYFAYLGYVYKADQLAESGSWNKARKFYAKVLNETSDVTLASVAAFKLARYYLEHAQRQKAIGYIGKILEGNRSYFAEHFSDSYDLAMRLSDHGDYAMAAAIAGALLDAMTPRHQQYEEVLKNRGIWLARAHDKAAAIESFERYLKMFAFGQYADEIKREKDALFFDMNDSNMSATLQAYNRIVEQYRGDAIAQKALYKKAKLLYDHHKYAQVVALQEALRALDPQEYDVTSLIDGAVSALMQEHLNRGECHDALTLSQQYEITLPDTWDEKIYFCAFEAGEYLLAKNIADKHRKTQTLNERMTWLYRYIQVDFKLGNYTEVLDASKELITLIKMEQNQ
ncbi:MAG: flagellar protein, partial [Sulfurimonas sp.]